MALGFGLPTCTQCEFRFTCEPVYNKKENNIVFREAGDSVTYDGNAMYRTPCFFKNKGTWRVTKEFIKELKKHNLYKEGATSA